MNQVLATSGFHKLIHSTPGKLIFFNFKDFVSAVRLAQQLLFPPLCYFQRIGKWSFVEIAHARLLIWKIRAFSNFKLSAF
jgi:hypothetical protein